eukprot:1858210-Rhodomonas_salina.1
MLLCSLCCCPLSPSLLPLPLTRPLHYFLFLSQHSTHTHLTPLPHTQARGALQVLQRGAREMSTCLEGGWGEVREVAALGREGERRAAEAEERKVQLLMLDAQAEQQRRVSSVSQLLFGRLGVWGA